MFFGAEVDMLGAEAAEDRLDLGKGRVRGAVLDEDEGLVVGVDIGPVEGVARDNVDVAGEVFFECLDLGVFTGRLAADDGTEAGCCNDFMVRLYSWAMGTDRASWMAHTRTVLGDNTTYSRRLNTVDNVVAGARHQVTVAENLYILL
jgi:hypothetical protein